MNTPTATSPVTAPAAVSVSAIMNPPELVTAEQEAANLRAKLALAEETVAKEKAAQEARVKEAQRSVILSLPEMLGVGNWTEAMILINEHVRGERNLSTQRPKRTAFPRALPEATLEQMKAMLMAGSTSRAVANALKVGLSTVDSRKAKWGLTQKRGGSRKRAPRAVKAKGGTHLSPAKRARIVDALKKPDVVISTLSKREGVSRQTLYSLRAKEHLIAA